MSNKCNNQDCFERINFLFQASNLVVQQHTEDNQSEMVSNYYTNLMRNIAKKSVLRMSTEIKRQICKKCNSLLIPGINCCVRIRNKGTKNVRWTCFKCSRIKRFNFQAQKEETNFIVAENKETFKNLI